jgi:DNA-binding MarR family transcriptional regulator
MTSSAPAFELDDFLPYRLAVLASRVSGEFAAIYGPRYGIGRAEWRVLAHLASAGTAVSVREVHARVDMDKPTVSRAAGRLELAGLIEKRVHDRDRRLVSLKLTAKGRRIMDELIALARSYERALLARLGPEDSAHFLRLVSVLLEKTDGRDAL